MQVAKINYQTMAQNPALKEKKVAFGNGCCLTRSELFERNLPFSFLRSFNLKRASQIDPKNSPFLRYILKVTGLKGAGDAIRTSLHNHTQIPSSLGDAITAMSAFEGAEKRELLAARIARKVRECAPTEASPYEHFFKAY